MQTSEHVRTVKSTSGTWETTTTVATRTEGKANAKATKSKCERCYGMAVGGSWANWLLLIPDYDGNPYELDNFIESVRWVGSRLGQEFEQALLLSLGSKLRDEARRCYRHKLQRYPSLEHFLQALYWQFSGVGNEDALLEALRNARQRDNEPLSEYAVRFDRLATQLYTIYGVSRACDTDLETSRSSTVEELLRDSVLTNFRRGLANIELEICLSSCQPKSFDQALPLAIALDRQLRRTRERPTSKSKSRRREAPRLSFD